MRSAQCVAASELLEALRSVTTDPATSCVCVRMSPYVCWTCLVSKEPRFQPTCGVWQQASILPSWRSRPLSLTSRRCCSKTGREAC